MRKMYRMILLLIMISIFISPVFAEDNQTMENHTTYRVLIDQYYGFFRAFEMYDKISGKELIQENRTLNISKGDTVIFVSDTIPDKYLTIVSKEKLWSDNNGTLKYSGKEISYTFKESGIYHVSIKERPLLKQKIIVGPLDANYTEIIDTNDNESNLTNVTEQNQTNITNDTKLNQTNVTYINDTESNSTQNNTTAIKQNATLNKSNSVPISIMLTGGLFSKIKSKSDTSILIVVLIGIYFLSARIKDD